MIGQYAFSELEADYSVANPFRELLKNPEAQLIYLVELYPYDENLPGSLMGSLPLGASAFGEYDMPILSGLSKVYLSDAGFTTEPQDNPSSEYFIAQVNNPLQFETSILSGDGFNGGNQSFGALTIFNGNGELDYLDDYYWSGRRVVVKSGSKEFTYNQFATVFDGAANSIEANDDTITITIRDNRIKTDQLIQAGVYEGTGGLEGGDDLANTPKPLAYGVVRNVEPVLVDAVNLIYQVHDGEIQAVDEVRDSGIPITYTADVADITAIAPAAGTYHTQLSGGYFRLGSSPAGQVTADVHGDSGNGFISTASEIVYRLVTTRLSTSLLPYEVDTGSLNKLQAVLSGETGLYIRDRISASEAIDQLISQSAAYWTFTRNGTLFVGSITEPAEGSLLINEDMIDEAGIRIAQNISPAWRISVGYQPSWTVQNDLAGAVDDTIKAFVGQQYRYVTVEDRLVRTKNVEASERVFNTSLIDKNDALALLDRLRAIYTVKRRVYQVPIYRGLFRLFLGDTVKLIYNRFGLENGKNLLVVGIAEDAETGQTTLSLWG